MIANTEATKMKEEMTNAGNTRIAWCDSGIVPAMVFAWWLLRNVRRRKEIAALIMGKTRKSVFGKTSVSMESASGTKSTAITQASPRDSARSKRLRVIIPSTAVRLIAGRINMEESRSNDSAIRKTRSSLSGKNPKRDKMSNKKTMTLILYIQVSILVFIGRLFRI